MPSFLRAPLYLLIAALSCGYLALADNRGWTLLQPFASAATRVHNAPIRHK